LGGISVNRNLKIYILSKRCLMNMTTPPAPIFQSAHSRGAQKRLQCPDFATSAVLGRPDDFIGSHEKVGRNSGCFENYIEPPSVRLPKPMPLSDTAIRNAH
ncbi:MAG: hypothetical protein QNJ20_19805, partial [Paracoccaceae bacterium]|nr:hypothetical protein [Paracoccaceae bacterium]